MEMTRSQVVMELKRLDIEINALAPLIEATSTRLDLLRSVQIDIQQQLESVLAELERSAALWDDDLEPARHV